jgi:L-lactate utilization protein LutC
VADATPLAWRIFMNPARDAFLERIRQAVEAGNRAGQRPPLDQASGVGYQGAGPDPVAHFVEQCQAAGAHCHVVPTPETAVDQIDRLLDAANACRVVIGRGAFLDTLRLPDALRNRTRSIWLEPQGELDEGGTEQAKETLFAADAGVTGVDWLIAETGTIALASRPGQARSLSLLPPLHIAVAERSQVLPDLFDLLDPKRFGSAPGDPPDLPACLTLITGPSKTGDIELKLVTGVHGPGEVHVVLVDDRR